LRLAHICDPSTQEAETGGSQVLCQSENHSEILSWEKKKRRSQAWVTWEGDI
jgi:hypothetical protein